VPADLAFVSLERHVVGAEIPEDRAQRSEPVGAEDDIIPSERQDEEVGEEGVAVNGERGLANDA
jgi:hypothetical protein